LAEDKLKLAVVGISHHTASISSLEAFQLNRKEIARTLHFFNDFPEISGTAIISTCNRVEFYFSILNDIEPFELVRKYYLANKKFDVAKKRNSFFVHKNNDATNHLFRVIAGLDSLVPGEYQIQGQIKEFYSIACSEKSADKIIHKLFHAAFRVGKNVRSYTSFGSGKQSVSGVAYQIISEKLKKDDSIAIIGVNQNSKIIAEKLFSSGFKKLIFINRTLHKAQQLADQFSGSGFGFDNLDKALSNVKCIFSSTGAPGYILTSGLLKSIFSGKEFPSLIVDIAVPRDIETDDLPGTTETYNLEGLKRFLENQQKEIAREIPQVEKIIKQETDLYAAWSETNSNSSVAYFDERIEAIRQQFLNDNIETLTKEESLILDKYSRSLIHRLKSTLHQIVLTGNIQNKAG
jgi:glutamyl-tRNA reductase